MLQAGSGVEEAGDLVAAEHHWQLTRVRQLNGLRARSGRSTVCVKKKRSADTMLFMVGTGMPSCCCSIWNRRRSSEIAVSGERPRNVAKRRYRGDSCAASPVIEIVEFRSLPIFTRTRAQVMCSEGRSDERLLQLGFQGATPLASLKGYRMRKTKNTRCAAHHSNPGGAECQFLPDFPCVYPS